MVANSQLMQLLLFCLRFIAVWHLRISSLAYKENTPESWTPWGLWLFLRCWVVEADVAGTAKNRGKKRAEYFFCETSLGVI